MKFKKVQTDVKRLGRTIVRVARVGARHSCLCSERTIKWYRISVIACYRHFSNISSTYKQAISVIFHRLKKLN